jgi:hypothetical protein
MPRKQNRKASLKTSRAKAKSGRGNHHAAPKPVSATRIRRPPGPAALARKGFERNTNGTSARRPIDATETTGRLATRGTRQHLMAGFARDRVVLMVRDPYWLHCYWELTHRAIERAEAALGEEWPQARPVLRVFDIQAAGKMGAPESVKGDIEIHGGCNSWYISVTRPPRSFHVDIGYRVPSGRFYSLARSNVVTTPRAGVSASIDENWADLDMQQAERICAMSAGYDPTAGSPALRELFEERLRRPLGAPSATEFGAAGCRGNKPPFHFHLDAELLVYGSTEPTARVTLQGEPIKLRQDGSFTIRYRFADSRQVIPAIATSGDGVEERTVILAVERNIKQLEPLVHDHMNEE